MELRNRNFVLIDTETTGYDEKKHQILEIGMLVIKNMEVVAELEVKVKHREYVLTAGAMKANSIDIVDHEKEALEEKAAAELILKFLNDNKAEEEEGYIVIGQNIGFDIKFLEAMFLRCYLIKDYRKVISYRNLDLMQLALIKNIQGKIDLEKQDLEHILNKLNIEIPSNRHRALKDCELTYQAMIKLLNL